MYPDCQEFYCGDESQRDEQTVRAPDQVVLRGQIEDCEVYAEIAKQSGDVRGPAGGWPAAAGGPAVDGPAAGASGLLVNAGSDVGTIASEGTTLVEPGSTGLPQEIASALSSTEQISCANCLCADIPTPNGGRWPLCHRADVRRPF